MAENLSPFIAGGSTGFDLSYDEQTPFELYGPTPPPLDDGVIQSRAQKYDFALAETSPGVDQLKYDIIAGREDMTRDYQLQKRKIADEQLRVNVLKEYVQGRPSDDVSQEEVQAILGAEPDELRDPSTLFEKLFAKKLFTHALTLDFDPTETNVDGLTIDNSMLGQAQQEDPEGVESLMTAGERIKVRRELALKKWEEINGRWSGEGLASTLSNYGELMLPFFSWSRISGAVEAAEAPSWLLGNNLPEQYQYVNNLPTIEEYNAVVNQTVDELYAKNPLDAMTWLKGLLSFTNTDQFLENAMNVVDMSVLAPVSLGGLVPAKALVAGTRRAIAAGSKLENVANTMKSVLKASGQPVTVPGIVADATGVVEKSSLAEVVRRVGAKATQTTSMNSTIEFLARAPSILNTDVGYGIAKGTNGREAADRLENLLETNAEIFLTKFFDQTTQAPRLDFDSLAQVAGEREVRDILNAQYGRQGDVVLDVSPIDPETTVGNANYVRALMGQVDGTYFDTAAQAIDANNTWYQFVGARVKAVGGKYGLEVVVPVNETATSVRDKLLIETKNEASQSLATMFLRLGQMDLRSIDDRVSKRISEEMKQALIGGSQLLTIVKQMAEPLRLTGDSKAAMNRFMSWERDGKPAKDALRGRFSSNLNEFGNNWFHVHKRLPTEKEATAYFVARQLHDMGWAVTNSGIYRDKSRKGMEMFGFNVDRAKGLQPTVEGVRVRGEDIYKYPDDAGIMFIDGDGSVTAMRKKYQGKNNMTEKELREKLASGEYRVVQLSKNGEDQFRKAYPEYTANWKSSIEFVVSKNLQSGPLELTQIPWRPGWHVELDDGWFIRQANISKASFDRATVHTYYGDTNFFHFLTQKEGTKIVENMNYARDLYKQGQKDKSKLIELKKYLDSGKSHLPYNYTQFVRLFKGKNAIGNLDEAFYLTRKGDSVEKAHALSKRYANWVDKNDSPYNIYNGGFNLEWAGERGDVMQTVVNTGSTMAPVYKFRKARHVDPMNTIDRAATSMARNIPMDDFKHVAAERWVATYGDVLEDNGQGFNALTVNPYKTLIDGQFKESIKGNRQLLASAQASRRAILEYLGTKTGWARDWDFQKAKLWEGILNKAGEKNAYKIKDWTDFLDGWSYGAIKNPVGAMRAFAFHTKLGLFNPVQLFLQAQTLTHVMGVSGPVNGVKAVEALAYQRAAMLAPQHTDFLLSKAFGWKTGELKEAYEWANKIGWYRVGREVAVRDDMVSGSAVSTRMGNFLEAGTMFFREGERIVRMAAWNAAYLEWRAANPTKAMSNRYAREILNRADLLSVNMTSASNASWQKGFPGIPTQFFAYQTRLMEQFLGKRLTPAEKSRALLTYSAVYGVPVAAGAYTGLWPWHEQLHQYLIDNQIDVDNNLAFKTLNDGMLSMAFEYTYGTEFNVGERWGPGGLPFIEDILTGDKTVLEAFGGVSGTSIVDFMKATEPFAYQLVQAVTPGSEEYKITQEDIVGLFRSANTGNQLYNLMSALNVGQYISKSGMTVDEVTGGEGVMNFIFGFIPARIDDTYRMMENAKSRKKYEDEKVKEAVTEFRKAFQPKIAKEDRYEHQRRAYMIMETANLPPDVRSRALNMALQNNESFVKSINWQYAQESPAHADFYAKQMQKRDRDLGK